MNTSKLLFLLIGALVGWSAVADDIAHKPTTNTPVYLSRQHPEWPPLPGSPSPYLKTTAFSNNVYLIEDLGWVYPKPEAQTNAPTKPVFKFNDAPLVVTDETGAPKDAPSGDPADLVFGRVYVQDEYASLIAKYPNDPAIKAQRDHALKKLDESLAKALAQPDYDHVKYQAAVRFWMTNHLEDGKFVKGPAIDKK